jgi:SAM-dependent methyltransferase
VELGRIYPPNYHAYNIRPKGQTQATLPLVTRLRHKIYKRRFHNALDLLRDRKTVELLDVGCGDGWMLDLYKMADPDRIRTVGVDFDEDVCQVARDQGHEVHCARFEDLDMAGKFDFVNLSHVIEHVSDPLAVARKSFDVLRPGGIFVLETPNTDTWDCNAFAGGAWGAYHIPRHWNLFSPETIRLLGERAGFTLKKIVYHPAPVHWVWTMHNLSLKQDNAIGRVGSKVFAPLDVFKGGAKPFLLLTIGTLIDSALITLTRRSSNMMAIFQKN